MCEQKKREWQAKIEKYINVYEETIKRVGGKSKKKKQEEEAKKKLRKNWNKN